MRENLSMIDRTIRGLAAVTIVILYSIYEPSDSIVLILGSFVGLLFITSFIGFCPVYRAFGISSKSESA